MENKNGKQITREDWRTRLHDVNTIFQWVLARRFSVVEYTISCGVGIYLYELRVLRPRDRTLRRLSAAALCDRPAPPPVNRCFNIYMSHSSPNRPSRDSHYFGFFSPWNMLKGVPKKSRPRSFRFFVKIFGMNITENNSKNYKRHCCTLSIWMKFWQWILFEKTNFLSRGPKWARLWFGICDKIKIEKKNFN